MTMNRRPNILVVVTDQHAKSAIGAYGSRFCHTPNIDRLAAEGVLFERAYTTCPICSPARASLHTGLYPFQHGMQTNIFMPGCMVHELPDTPTLLSRRLGRAGYALGYTGKWHLGYGRRAFEDQYFMEHAQEIERFRDLVAYPAEYRRANGVPTALGFTGDDFPGHGCGGVVYPLYLKYLETLGQSLTTERHGEFGHVVTSSEETTVDYFLVERSKRIIESLRSQGRPWCHMLNFWGPHEPYYPPRAFFDRYRDMVIPSWPSFAEDRQGKPRIHGAKRLDLNWAHFQDELRLYYAYASFIDAQIGRLVTYLRDTGEWENTVIIFLADHGDSMGVHGGLVDKGYHLYEETVSIPLIVRPAGGSASRRESALVSIADVHATILDVAGVRDEPSRSHRRSLLPLVRGEKVDDWPHEVVVECSGLGPALHSSRMIRCDSVKYVFHCGGPDELYDLARDPHEMRNLAGSAGFAKLLREMRARLGKWLHDRGDPLHLHYPNLIRD